MKKVLLIVVILSLFCVSSFAGTRFAVLVRGNYLAPSDDGFKEIYGNSVMYPEFKAEFRLTAGIYVWGGVGFFSKTGTTPVLMREAKSKQTILTGGLGYMAPLAPKLKYKLEAGVLRVGYEEESLGVTWSDSAIGIKLEGGLSFNVTRSLFVQAALGYLSASDTVDDVSIKLGGFNTSFGVGVAF
ncbi:MAG: hypothetical protein GY950_06075 [bacterium]|nr:hypothetical protein [bacterium]